jgi:hypothetical protein
MRLDSSGNLGLGVTPQTWDSGFSQKAIQISSGGSISALEAGAGNIQLNISNNAYDFLSPKYLTNNTSAAYRMVGSSHYWFNAPSGTAGNAITFTQAMTLDGSGNLLVGKTTQSLLTAGCEMLPFGAFTSTRSGDVNTILNRTTSDGKQIELRRDNTAIGVIGSASGGMYFGTGISGAERMRIDSSGNCLIGTTGLTNNGKLTVSGTTRLYTTGDTGGVYIDKSTSTTTTSQVFMYFTVANQATGSGQINANGASQAAFGSFSDSRLKENIVNLPSQLDKICSLRPVEFDYIESEGGGHQIGFIAQEIQNIYPDSVGTRDDGMLTVTGWNKTEAILVKAIQELKAEFDAYKATHP